MPHLLLIALLLALPPLATAQDTPARFIAKLQAGEKITLVTLGTSLSAGASGWPVAMKAWLDSDFPGQVTLFNHAVSGSASSVGPDGKPQNSGLDVLPSALARKPHAIFIEFATNDAHQPYKISPDQSKANLGTLIDRILDARPDTEIIVQTMNSTIDVPGRGNGATNRPNLAAYFEGYRDVARARKIRLVDHHPNWLALMERDREKFLSLVPDGLHPTPAGYREILLPELKRALLSSALLSK